MAPWMVLVAPFTAPRMVRGDHLQLPWMVRGDQFWGDQPFCDSTHVLSTVVVVLPTTYKWYVVNLVSISGLSGMCVLCLG